MNTPPMLAGAAGEWFSPPDFGDRRLAQRLGTLFNGLVKNTGATLPKKLPSRAELVGGYRFFNHAKTSHEALLDSHRQAVVGKLSADTLKHPISGPLVIAHDTTEVDFSGLDVSGLGQIGNGKNQGVHLHNSLLVDPAGRHPMGLLNQRVHIRAEVSKDETRGARMARNDRESRLWRDALTTIPALPGHVRTVDVSDRGSDIMEYLAYLAEHGRNHVVRSKHNRLVRVDGTDEVGKLHDRLRAGVSMGTKELTIPARDTQPARAVVLDLHWESVSLLPPKSPRGDYPRQPLNLNALIAKERGNANGLEWILLTDLPIESQEDAHQSLDFYGCRWVVEEYHKALKTGCGVEELQLTTLDGLKTAIAAYSVMALELLTVRTCARDPIRAEEKAVNEVDPLLVELVCAHAKLGDCSQITVASFYLAVARMGGYMANPKKRPPGWQLLWHGWTKLQHMAEGVRLLRCVHS